MKKKKDAFNTEELLKQLLQELQNRTDEWLAKNEKKTVGWFDDVCYYTENIEASNAPEFVKLYFRLKSAGVIVAVYPFMVNFK